MKFYLKQNVFDAALERIRFLFNEFENVYINFSGGKDSTVLMEIALMIARETKRLPLKIMFIDQEFEWSSVISYIRRVANRDEIQAYWLQVPFHLFNATSPFHQWWYCWDPNEEKNWLREKEPDSIKEDIFGKSKKDDKLRFFALFDEFLKYLHPNDVAIHVAGVRAEESPGRLRGLTTYATYKWITWGKKDNKNYTFYPLYDWRTSDIWKTIFDHNLDYCKLYDYQYQYGIPVKDMRVSSLCHETAVRNIFYLHEVEKDLLDKASKRMPSVESVVQMRDNFLTIKELPFMFSNWEEYRDFLLEKLVVNSEHREILRKKFKAHEGRYIPPVQQKLTQAEIKMILVNDFEDTKFSTFHAAHGLDAIKYRKEHNLSLEGSLGKGYVDVSKK